MITITLVEPKFDKDSIKNSIFFNSWTSHTEQQKTIYKEQANNNDKSEILQRPSQVPTLALNTESLDLDSSYEAYKDEKYEFGFSYPTDWVKKKVDEGYARFIDPVNDYEIGVLVWRPTGWAYCYKFDKEKSVIVADRVSPMGEGVGITGKKGEGLGCNHQGYGYTYVLVPLEKNSSCSKISPRQEYVMLDITYPLENKDLAHRYLDVVLSSMWFKN